MGKKEQEQIESILKNSVNKIDKESFDKRWNAIELELDFDRSESEIVESRVPVLAGQGVNGINSNDRQSKSKKNIITIIACSFLILLLAIILPIYLNKKEQSYFSPTDLLGEVVTEDEFHIGVSDSGIELVDLTNFNCQEFSLLKTNAGEVQGGNFSINNDIENEIVNVSFFSKLVQIPNYDFTDPEIYKLNEIDIQFKKIDNNDNVFQYKAYARYKEVTYKLDYYCLTDNILEFFNDFFI